MASKRILGKKTQILLVLLFFILNSSVIGEETNSCISEMVKDKETMMAMLMATGKGINDMGDMDQCDKNPHTGYAVSTIKGVPVYFGICIPLTCTHEDLAVLEDGISSLAKQMGMEGEGLVYFPRELAYTPSTASILLNVFYGIFFIFILIGMLVEYTSLFSKNPSIKGDTDKDLVENKSMMGLFFLSFSFSRNLKKLFYSPKNPNDFLTVFNGVRVISMYHVVLGHLSMLVMVSPSVNFLSAQTMAGSWWAIYIIIGFYSVDTFFFMSAFLGTYLMIDKMAKTKIWMVYFHRILRVVPPLALYIGLFVAFGRYTGSGPLWDYTSEFYFFGPCRDNWWAPLIFINEFYPEMPCLGQLWYLANEMLFFLLIPFIVLAYIHNRKAGYFLTSFLILVCFVLTFIFSHIRNHGITKINDPGDKYHKEFYNYPVTRFAAYYTGSFFGLMYYEWKKSQSNPELERTFGARFYEEVKTNKIARYGLCFFGACVMIGLILAPRIELQNLEERMIPQIPSDIFNTFHRTVFVICFAFFFAGSMVGKTKFITGVFGGDLWAPWGKVTFTAYLFHILVISLVILQTKSAIYITGENIVFLSYACFLITIILSVPLALIIESPILQLEKLILFPSKPKKSPKKKREPLVDQHYFTSSSSLNSEEETRTRK